MRYQRYVLLIAAIFFAACSSKAPEADPIPQHDQFKLYSKAVLEERTINVWLPEDYKNSTD